MPSAAGLSPPDLGASQARTGSGLVEICETPAAAELLADQWQSLADRAIMSNPFLEPWFLIPALRNWGVSAGAVLVVVRGGEGGPLLALLPLRRRATLSGLPLPHLEGWMHPHAFLGTPLIAPGSEAVVWAALRRHVADQSAWALTLSQVPEGGGGFAAGGVRPVEIERFERTALRPDIAGAEAYMAAASSSGSRKDWRRLRRRLGETGRLELRKLEEADAAAGWIEAFLALEADGWKGQNGTALASTDKGSAFFRDMASAAARLGRLHMLGLFLDGRPVAMQCNLMSRSTYFAFKVAYDEAQQAYSPGALLEVDAVAEFHCHPGLELVDSCTKPESKLMGRLWGERLTMRKLLIPATGIGGALAAAAVQAGLALCRGSANRKNLQ